MLKEEQNNKQQKSETEIQSIRKDLSKTFQYLPYNNQDQLAYKERSDLADTYLN